LFQLESGRRYQIPTVPSLEGVESVATVLSIENDLVFNCLVDFCRIEQKFVARDRIQSERHLLTRGANGQPAMRFRDIKEVYLLPKGDHWTVRSGSVAIFSNERPLQQKIGADQRAAIAAAEERLRELTESLNSEKQGQTKVQQENAQLVQRLNRAMEAETANHEAIEQLTERIANLRDEKESCDSVEVDTSELEDEVDAAQDNIDSLRKKEEHLRAESTKLLQPRDDAQDRFNELKRQNQKMQQEISDAQQEYLKHAEATSQGQSIVEKKQLQLAEYEKRVKELDGDAGKLEDILEENLDKARRLQFMVHEREKTTEDKRPPNERELEAIEPVTVTHDPDYYEARVQRTKTELKKQRRQQRMQNEESPADALAAYLQAKKDLDAEAKSLDQMKTAFENLQNDLREREKRWVALRDHLEVTSQFKFSEYMLLNDYSGSLKYDHEMGTLDLVVRKEAEEQYTDSKDVKALRYIVVL